jgi:XTP/dITP diphosphohydrolase
MRRIVLASSNRGKLAELHEILGGLDIELVPQSELGIGDADEAGLSFVENALLKARHASRMSGLPALGDDSGLCVDALQGAPGLYSARYAGEHGNADKNIDKLLAALHGVPDEGRGAHFHCTLALLRHAEYPAPLIAEGRWNGRILSARRGTGGFGYDPVFFDPVHQLGAAEMAPALKNRFSHRGIALMRLRDQIGGS